MAACKVWFNKTISASYSVFNLIRQADIDRRFHLFCTHPYADFIGFSSADSFEREPAVSSDVEYMTYVINTCQRHGVDVLVPNHRVRAIELFRREIEKTGTRLCTTAGAETLALLDDKSKLYEHLAKSRSQVRIPIYAVVRNVDEFDRAVVQFQGESRKICIKPAVSMFGLGFRILAEANGGELRRLMKGDTTRVGREHLRTLMLEEESFPAIMVMQYLEGPERSVDCLARDGRLLRSVSRLKSTLNSGQQCLDENEAINAMVEELTRKLGLNGLFNIQFKESDGVSYLLEINPRMSGGLSFTAHSGLNLPYWLLRTLEGSCQEEDIPFPQSGISYAQYTSSVVLH